MSSALPPLVLAALLGGAAFGAARWCGLVGRAAALVGLGLLVAVQVLAGLAVAALLAAAVTVATAVALFLHRGRPRPAMVLRDDVAGVLARWAPGALVAALAPSTPAPFFWLTAAAGALVAGAATLTIDAHTPPPGSAGAPPLAASPPARRLAVAAATAIVVAALAQGLGLTGRGDAAPVALAAMAAVLSRPLLARGWRGSAALATATTAGLAALVTRGLVALLP